MLVFALDAEEGEQHQEDEKVVHRQRFLYQVACQEFHRFLMRIARIEQVDTTTEQQRYANPYGSHLQCFRHLHLMLAFLTE